MVATRRGANKVAEAAPAPANTLNAPPKRNGGRKKAAAEEIAAPTPTAPKPTRTTAAKRKAKEVPEAAEEPMSKKTTASRTTRTAKAEPRIEPVAAAPKRATRARKAEDAAVIQKPIVVEPESKPATTRARKAPVEQAATPEDKDALTVVEETPNLAVESRPAPRSRKATAKKVLVAKKIDLPASDDQPVAPELEKPASRTRKAAAPKIAPASVVAARPTRNRSVVSAPQESPLKVPARKPARSNKKQVAMAAQTSEPSIQVQMQVSDTVDEGFHSLPQYPTTPAHIPAPLTSRKAMAELPNYPNTPAHIKAPISSKDGLATLPGYPQTPAHIMAPINNMVALSELPSYPKTPAHIKAPISNSAAMAEMPGYPQTPAHIVAPLASQDALKELPSYPHTPAHIQAPMNSNDALKELPDYPETPTHITACRAAPETSVEVASDDEENGTVLEPMDMDGPSFNGDNGSVHIASPTQVAVTIGADATQSSTVCAVSTPSKAYSSTIEKPTTSALTSAVTPTQSMTMSTELQSVDTVRNAPPSQIVWDMTNQEAFEELPDTYPATPAHVVAPITVKDALKELPGYPKTPAHITAPLTPRRALAELPSYPTTPAHDLEIAIQEEICASVKKQTPSPSKISSLEDVSFQFAENSEITDLEVSEIESGTPRHEPTPMLQTTSLVPLQFPTKFSIPDPVSPKKSALRSPLKTDAKTPKKAVTWDDPEESELFLYDGPLQGMTFLVDVTRNGMDQNHLFSGLLEDLGAKVVPGWNVTNISHVLFKDGSGTTLEKVVASKGAIKCVNVGWILDSEKNKMRMEESPYLVDLSAALPASPRAAPTPKPFTPARTPSKYALPPSSECRSVPTTPTSSEFDRSINFDDKENQEHGIFFDGNDKMEIRTVPPKKSSFLFSRSPIRTPSKPSFLLNTPMKVQSAIKPFSTTKKRSLADSTFGGLSVGPPKKFRLF